MEVNTVRKNISRVQARVAYVYPSLYKAMISGLSADIVYQMLNANDEIYVERFTCSKLYGREENPRSIETGSPLKDFTLILSSLHYEPDIVNIARILLASGLGVSSKKREKHVVIAGGPACIENPVPYAGVVDACVIGEAEATLPEIANLWLEYGDNRKRFLEELSQLNYVYVHGYERERYEKVFVVDLDSAFYPLRQVENTEVEPVYGRGLKVEVSRGCPHWCSFCIETRAFNPYRERSYQNLVKIVEKGLQYTTSGKRVVLFSLAFPVSNSNIRFLEYLAEEGFKASFPSARISPLLEKSLDLIKTLGQRTLVLAPETFSPILQRALFKYMGLLDYVVEVIERVLKCGFNVKLYLIYGFKGTETASVITENIRIITMLAKLAKSLGRVLKVSLNPLIPKPHTLFQYVGMIERDALMDVLREYRQRLRGLAEFGVYDVDWAIVQSQIALSRKPLEEFIAMWAYHGGGLAGWRRAVREMGVDYKYVFTGYNVDEELPWNKIRLGDYVGSVTLAQYEVYKKLATLT